MKDLNAIFTDCVGMCKRCGIPVGRIVDVSPNYRAKSRWGQCRKTPSGYSININERLLHDDVSDTALIETLLHEILHTCDGCMNHSGLWKLYGETLRRSYGYNITVKSSCDEKGIYDYERVKTPKYQFRCECCGQTVSRTRRSDFVVNTHMYRCGKCSGRFVRVS